MTARILRIELRRSAALLAALVSLPMVLSYSEVGQGLSVVASGLRANLAEGFIPLLLGLGAWQAGPADPVKAIGSHGLSLRAAQPTAQVREGGRRRRQAQGRVLAAAPCRAGWGVGAIRPSRLTDQTFPVIFVQCLETAATTT